MKYKRQNQRKPKKDNKKEEENKSSERAALATELQKVEEEAAKDRHKQTLFSFYCLDYNSFLIFSDRFTIYLITYQKHEQKYFIT